MNEVNEQYCDAFLDMLREADERGAPLSLLHQKLTEYIGNRGEEDAKLKSQEVISHVLENCLAIKTIDYPGPEYQPLPPYEPTWFLKLLEEEERRRYQNLDPVDHALLKLLYSCNRNGSLGMMKRSDAVEKLRKLGFDVEHVPYIPDVTDEAMTAENGEMVWLVYIVPRYQLRDDEELAEEIKKQYKKIERHVEEFDEDE